MKVDTVMPNTWVAEVQSATLKGFKQEPKTNKFKLRGKPGERMVTKVKGRKNSNKEKVRSEERMTEIPNSEKMTKSGIKCARW